MRNWCMVLVVLMYACGGKSADVTGSEAVQAPIVSAVQLQAPSALMGRWSTAENALMTPGSDNVVILTPSYAKDDVEGLARFLVARRLPVIVYAGHIYCNDRSGWESAWVTFNAYLEPLRASGVLVGIQPLDEPRWTGYQANADAAYADVRARGYRVLATEYADQVWGPFFNKRPNVDWWAITCYPYPGAKWTAQRCEERLVDDRSVDTLAAINGSGYDSLPWIRAAERQGRGWLVWEE